MCKPGRSEEPLPQEEAAAFEAQAAQFLEALAPKHAAKPPRSEVPEPGEAVAFDATPAADVNDAEKRHLAELNKSGKPVIPAPVEDLEEYHRSNYYSAVSVGEKHCTIGEGFIALGVKQDSPVKVAAVPQATLDLKRCLRSPSFTNPARDDWQKSSQQLVL